MSGVPQFSQMLTSSKADGAAFNTFTTAKSVINASELVGFPVNYVTIGSRFRVRAMGGWSNVVTAQNQLTFQVMVGSVIAFSSGAIASSATAAVGLPFEIIFDLRINSLTTVAGTPATQFRGVSKFTGPIGASAAQTSSLFPTAAPALGTAFDGSVGANIDFWVACQTSNAGNGVQIFDYSVEQFQF